MTASEIAIRTLRLAALKLFVPDYDAESIVDDVGIDSGSDWDIDDMPPIPVDTTVLSI